MKRNHGPEGGSMINQPTLSDRLHKAGPHLHVPVTCTGLTLGTGGRRSDGMWLPGERGPWKVSHLLSPQMEKLTHIG